jgi:putative PIN family toxin of toxin-antitoxin system
MLPLVIIDTNVVVSGLITVDASSPTCQVLDGMLSARFRYLLSPDLLDEYRAVLLRSKIKMQQGLETEDVDRILTELVTNAIWREPVLTVLAPDSGDDHLWALLSSFRGSVLVTGDRLLLENPPDFASVIKPLSFLALALGAPRNPV